MPLRIVLFAIVFGCLGACSRSAPDPQPPAEPAASATEHDLETAIWMHDASDLEPEEGVIFGQLDNGMRYIIMQNDRPENTASMRLRIDAGSLNEADNQRGISHFLEHMAFNGSTNVPEGEMIKILERFGLAFGPDTNAFTSFDQIQYQLDLPSTDKEMLDTGFFLMRETASNLTLDPEAIDKERGVIASEARARNSVGLRAALQSTRFQLPETIAADRFPIGDLDVIATADRERFVEIYKASYRPELATFVIVGDFDPETIRTEIKSSFGDWQGIGEAPPEPEIGQIDPDRPTEADVFYDPDTSTSVSIRVVKPHSRLPDTAAQRRQNLIDAIGHGVLNRRFASLARGADAPFIGAGAGDSNFFNIARSISVTASTTPEGWQDGLAAIEQELRRALEFGFSQSEIDEQLANIRTSLENQIDQFGTRLTPALASQLAGSVNETVFTTPASGLERFEKVVQSLTPEIIHEAFKAQWADANPLLQLSTNIDTPTARDDLLAAFEASRNISVSAPIAQETQSFAYTNFGPAGKIVSDTRIEDLDVRMVRFENNVRLNIKSTDFEDAIIRISTLIGGGELEFPQELDGLGSLLGFFPAGGLQAHTVDQLQSLLAGRSVSVNLGADTRYFSSNAATTPDDFELQMQLLTALITAPGFRPEAEQQYRQAIAAFYETIDAEPGGVAAQRVPRILNSGDTRFGLASEEDLLARNFEELKAVTARAFSEGAIEIGIVGDIDEQTAIDVVARTFGALPARLADPLEFADARQVKFPSDRTPITLTHAGLPDKALAMVYWPTDSRADQKTNATQTLLRAVMRLKLTETLREELGATYSPSAESVRSAVFPGYGYLSARSNVEPGDVDRVMAAIDEIATGMANGSITDDELQRARQPVLENIEEQLENNSVWLGFIDTAQTDPDYLAEVRMRTETYKAITRDDLTAMAAKYLKTGEALKIRIISENWDG
jgi:zinc protease